MSAFIFLRQKWWTLSYCRTFIILIGTYKKPSTDTNVSVQNIKNINTTLQSDMQALSCKVFDLSECELLQRENRSAGCFQQVSVTLSTSQSHWYLNGRTSGGELNHTSNSSWSVVSFRDVLFHIIRITWWTSGFTNYPPLVPLSVTVMVLPVQTSSAGMAFLPFPHPWLQSFLPCPRKWPEHSKAGVTEEEQDEKPPTPPVLQPVL